MTLDAMHWVWNHSQAKGNPRLALLYIADQVRTPAAEVRVSYGQLMDALNSSSRSTVSGALTAAEKLGELVIAEAGSGRRPPLYRLPKAVGYVRTDVRSGPEVGPQSSASSPEPGPLDPDTPTRSGPEVGLHPSRSGPDFARSGPEVGPLTHTHKEPAGPDASQPDAFRTCQPLITAMTQAGITVSWSMQTRDWREIATIVQRAGIDAMVGYARSTAATARQPIRYATFFLKGGWRGLPPMAAPTPRSGSNNDTPHCGDPDCDPISRQREREDEHTGLRSNYPCPECHPTRKDQAA